MSITYSFIDEITPYKETWKIKTRIIRTWRLPSFDNSDEVNNIKLVLMDEKGNKIQRTIKRSLIKRFSHLIVEGEIRIISIFGVGENTTNYRATQHPYKINFFSTTSVRVHEDQNISANIYHFVPFENIACNRVDRRYLVDVIGQVIGVGSIESREKMGKQSRGFNLELEDLEKQKMKCTLWGEYAEQISSYVAENCSDPIILIIELARIKKYKGEITLSNSLYSTRLLINADIDEVQEFKKMINIIYKSLPQRLSQISTQTSYTNTKEFLYLNERKTVDEICEIQKVGCCVVFAKILCIQLEHNWFYLSCKNCNKKVKDVGGSTYFCQKCSSNVNYVVPRYKVQIRVVDNSGSASFVMFDREVTQFLHKSASDLRESLEKTGDSFPEELNIFVDKKFLFKIEVSNFNLDNKYPVYTVLKFTDDENILNAFISSSPTTQNQDSASFMGDNESDLNHSTCITQLTKRPFQAFCDTSSIEGRGTTNVK